MAEDPETSKLLEAITDLGRATHSSFVLVTSAALDDALQTAILTKLRPDLSNTMKERLFENYGPLSSGAAKIDVAFALGIISEDERSDFHLIKSIRNEFAHPQETMHFEHPEIGDKLRNLPKARRDTDNRTTFNQLVSDCFKCLAAQRERTGLVSALMNYTAQPPTSPETSEPPRRARPDQD